MLICGCFGKHNGKSTPYISPEKLPTLNIADEYLLVQYNTIQYKCFIANQRRPFEQINHNIYNNWLLISNNQIMNK